MATDKVKPGTGPKVLSNQFLKKEKEFHQQHPNTELVICTMLNWQDSAANSRIARHLEGFKEKLLDLDRKNTFFSPTKVFITPELAPNVFKPDGLHPTIAGAQMIASAFVRQLA